MSVTTTGQYTIYTLPRKFKSDAKLHPFLAMKTPDMIKANIFEYTLFTVLSAMRSLISTERLYDANNTTVIICSLELEKALGMKSLHVTEVRDVVLTQMEVLQPELLASLPESHPAETVRNNAPVGGQQQPAGKFDVNGRFYVKPHFLRVLRTVQGIDKSQILFSYKEVTSYLSQYILDHKDRFFDDRNIKIAHVENDLLGVAFNVKAFHRTQVTTLLRNQLIPQKDSNGFKSQNSQRSGTTVVCNAATVVTTELTNPLHDLASRKRASPSLAEPSPKRSLTIRVPDPTQTEDKEHEENKDDDSDSDEEPYEYDVYEIEYEPEEASDDDEKDPKKSPSGDNSSGESEIENNIILATVANILENQDDDSLGADASSDDDDDDFTVCDLENRDHWTCLECKQPNTPYIRYCSTCYKERKGWLPARPKPKKKRKKTNDVLIKSEASTSSQIPSYDRSQSQESVKSEKSESQTSASSQDSGFGEGEEKSQESSDEFEENHGNARKPNFAAKSLGVSATENLCTLCLSRPKDACLIHGRTSHQLCCYSCAKRLYKKRQGCPVCRRKIEKITKNIVA